MEKDSLWKKVIKIIYGLQGNGWDVGVARNSTFRSPWKFISRIYPAFHVLTGVVLKGGTIFDSGRISGGGFHLLRNVFQLCFKSHCLGINQLYSLLVRWTLRSVLV